MDTEDIERRLATLHAKPPGPGLRGRILASARETWAARVDATMALWEPARSWGMAIAATMLVCAAISWREEHLMADRFSHSLVAEDASERALRVLCAEVGLDHGYAARWALISREAARTGDEMASLRRELAIQ